MLCGVIPPFLFLGVFIFLTVDAQGPVGGQGADACCPLITVNSDKVEKNLNGDYSLKKKQSSKPDEICINGCVYAKPKEPENEFCFIVDNEYKADVQCSAVTSLPLPTISTTNLKSSTAATSSSPTVKITNGGGTTTIYTTEGPIVKSTTPTSNLKSSTSPATMKSTSTVMSVKSTSTATSAKSTSNAAKASPTTSVLSSKSIMSTTGTVTKQSSTAVPTSKPSSVEKSTNTDSKASTTGASTAKQTTEVSKSSTVKNSFKASEVTDIANAMDSLAAEAEEPLKSKLTYLAEQLKGLTKNLESLEALYGGGRFKRSSLKCEDIIKRIETYKTIEDNIQYILTRIDEILTDLSSLRDQNPDIFKKLDEYKEYFNDKLEHKKSQREPYEKDYESRCKTSVASKSTPGVTLTSAPTSGLTTIATTDRTTPTPAMTASQSISSLASTESSTKVITDETTPLTLTTTPFEDASLVTSRVKN